MLSEVTTPAPILPQPFARRAEPAEPPILFGWHPFIGHDGPVSLQRAFLPCERQQLLAAAVESHAMNRLCVSRIR
jgi:hypothetical protein